MSRADETLFNAQVWTPALEKFGAVTHLTVVVCGTDEQVVCGPTPSTPLFTAFAQQGFDPGLFRDCARRCLAQGEKRPAVVIAPASGLAVVGCSLVLEETIVGAAVAGYALTEFPPATRIERLAREASLPFRTLWEVTRQQAPVPERRLVLHGELLQVLGDTILRENLRTRQYEVTAAQLVTEMAAKDEFLAVLSHELRTPLTPILGWVHILKGAGDTPDNRRKGMASIERNALLQSKLVADLLDLNRLIRDKVPLELALHDLSDVVRSTVDTTANMAADKLISVELTGAPGRLPVRGDLGRLQQAFLNILSNAVKFTPLGGSVRLEVERDGDTGVVRIADTGEGISAEFLPHVFDMFRQQEEGTRRRHAGLGIGLALVKRLVELHEGTVAVASGGEGQGTEVTVRLPLARPGQGLSRGEGGARPAAERPLQDLTILVVEDTEDTLEATGALLEVLGARVLQARDGQEALELLATSRPDLVLCDLRMPRMDGYEFFHELSRRHGEDHPPVVALTGLASETDHRKTRDAGFDGHLDKPFDRSSLVSTVRASLGHRRAG